MLVPMFQIIYQHWKHLCLLSLVIYCFCCFWHPMERAYLRPSTRVWLLIPAHLLLLRSLELTLCCGSLSPVSLGSYDFSLFMIPWSQYIPYPLNLFFHVSPALSNYTHEPYSFPGKWQMWSPQCCGRLRVVCRVPRVCKLEHEAPNLIIIPGQSGHFLA